MKRCPTCQQTFEPHLTFCLEDGTPLIKVEAEPYDPEATVVSASPRADSTTLDALPRATAPNVPSDWPRKGKASVYQPPANFVPAPTPSRAWPWVIGIVLLLMIGGAGVAAAILIPKLIRAAPAANENQAVESNANRPSDNRNANGNSNSANTNSNSNANSNSNPETATAPTDEARVLADLTAIENEWQVANVEGDKQKLQRILAEDYVGTQADGSNQGKADYIKDLKPDPSIKHSEFKNLKVTLKSDRATLVGLVRLEVEIDGQVREVVLRFTDKFVWRAARWQAVGSEIARVD